MLNESSAYKLAGQCLKPIEKKCEPYLLQQVADKIVSALIVISKSKEKGQRQ